MELEFDESEEVFVRKAERYCAADEQCVAAVRAKLVDWGTPHELKERILHHLIQNDFLNERRFAVGYAQSKLRYSHWGRNKIAYQLRTKQLAKADVDAAVASLDPELYVVVLDRLLSSRWPDASQPLTPQQRGRLVSYLQGRGFATEEIWEAIGRHIETNHNEIQEQ
ncbi:MAG: RecX family transcriptional regulator [Bacteroidales bacterium]|nr:RecX family transcriptional regulator [Bacteroidales bacterium]